MRLMSLHFVVLLMAIIAAQSLRAQETKAPFKVVAYVPNWIDLKAFVPTIQWDKVTHLNLAFENPENDAGDLGFNPQNQILIDAAHAHKIPISLSIGGGSASGDKALTSRYFALIGDKKRTAFVAKLVDYLTKHNFDGLDVDLEGPSINGDYGAFVRDLSTALKPQGKLLTCALSQGYGGPKVPDTALAVFDWVNIMAYDGAGYWEPNAPGQHSSFAFAVDNVAYWLKRGLPAEKAVLGVPFYGYGFGTAFRQRDYPFADILKNFPDAATRDKIGDTIWYNGVPTIEAKTRYAREQKLGGVMIWSLDSDATGENSLLSAISRAQTK